MGRASDFGLGVTKDRAEAVQWYRKAAPNQDLRRPPKGSVDG